ncbi:phosphatase PAP2 family protein [Allomuricauda taeanensis]|uniref:phosphatase PAP2 family protein n=1 Tax=Flagellimonas taeanensis TaxID=1005926 RepID=UPI002E7ACC70|nr:phosphatase PAP2 family protein [Allomuricauda taeanensis]MEE1962430.1 phosphatase PAP2 family protein [Allomuricauda taeanensis]
MLEKLLQWDRDTFVYLNSLGIEKYDAFWSTVTNIATWTPLFVLFLVLLYMKFPKKDALYKFLTVLGLVIFVTAITHFTKISVARLRPNNTEEINTLIRILKTPTDYSFFSGHASSSFSIAMLMYLFLRAKLKWALLFFIWPILFTMSRIYVGVHFPIDIIVGTVVGLLSGWLFHALYKRFITPYSTSVHP